MVWFWSEKKKTFQNKTFCFSELFSFISSFFSYFYVYFWPKVKTTLVTMSWGCWKHPFGIPGVRPMFLKPKLHEESKNGFKTINSRCYRMGIFSNYFFRHQKSSKNWHFWTLDDIFEIIQKALICLGVFRFEIGALRKKLSP